MASFNASLPAGSVVVAVDHKYNDNDGAYSIAVVWDGSVAVSHNYSNGYNGVKFDAAVKDATDEQVKAAAEWYINTYKDISEDHRGNPTFIGCTVTLSRSRKAPNKTPLKVTKYAAGGYNKRYGCWDQPKVCVDVQGQPVWVSVGCISEVLQGDTPWWM